MQTQTAQVCNTVASRLVFARDQKGFDQETVAHSAEITPELLARYENGAVVPTKSMVWRLSQAIGCDYGWLIDQPGFVIPSNCIWFHLWTPEIEPSVRAQLFDVYDILCMQLDGRIPEEFRSSAFLHNRVFDVRKKHGLGVDVSEYVLAAYEEWCEQNLKGGVEDAAQYVC